LLRRYTPGERIAVQISGASRRKKNSSRSVPKVVSILGVVHRSTDVGVFLDVNGRRVLIPADCMVSPSRKYETGQIVRVEIDEQLERRRGVVASRER
jgi:ribosomal protein L21E